MCNCSSLDVADLCPRAFSGYTGAQFRDKLSFANWVSFMLDICLHMSQLMFIGGEQHELLHWPVHVRGTYFEQIVNSSNMKRAQLTCGTGINFSQFLAINLVPGRDARTCVCVHVWDGVSIGSECDWIMWHQLIAPLGGEFVLPFECQVISGYGRLHSRKLFFIASSSIYHFIEATVQLQWVQLTGTCGL